MNENVCCYRCVFLIKMMIQDIRIIGTYMVRCKNDLLKYIFLFDCHGIEFVLLHSHFLFLNHSLKEKGKFS